MPSTIITKNSSTASSVPSAGSLTQGELAVNVADKRLYTKDSGGTVVELGTNPASLTMPNGTANGIAYLNGSKVVTSGTALSFDGSNLGLGVTPSAWDSVFKSFDGGGAGCFGSLFFQANGDYTTALGSNLYYSSGWKYKATAAAGKYELKNNTHAWYTAPSGTAGNAITFTQAMTLDASGRLGIGETSPSTLLHVKSTDVAFTANTLFDMAIIENGASGFGAALQIVAATNGSSEIGFSDTTRNIGKIGYDHNSNAMVFDTNGSERARIDSSGNLLVGTTSSYGGMINFLTTSGRVTAITTRPSTNITYNAADFQNSSGTGVGGIGVTNSSTSFSTSSDYRLKNTIVPMTNALAKVALLKPVTYKWNADGSDGEGFIAHELAEVCPDAVVGEKDAVDAEGNPKYQGIDTSFLVATLTAALQEQQAIITSQSVAIESLKARLDAANL